MLLRMHQVTNIVQDPEAGTGLLYSVSMAEQSFSAEEVWNYPIPVVLVSCDILPLVTFRASVNRYAPVGMVISNRAPFPGSPVSTIDIPVMARISRMRNRPYPWFSPFPRMNKRFFISGSMPTPLSS